jgi:hypothetical protein
MNSSTLSQDFAPLPGPRPAKDLEALAGPGLRAFFRISQEWSLSVEEQMDLLGLDSRSTYFAWKRAQTARLSRDQLERISHVLGIYKSLRILFPALAQAGAWVKRPNTAPLFEGRPAIERMRLGIRDLFAVRTYLDAQRGGWA